MIFFNKLYYLNCDQDKASNRDRYDTVKNLSLFNDLNAEYHQINTKKDFVDFIDLVLLEVKTKGVYPYIHFEAHGSKDGVVLNSGARIRWLELSNYFKQINIACRCNLILFMASCYGAYFFMILFEHLVKTDGNRRAPFRASIGPTGEISYEELEEKVDLFYVSLISKDFTDIGEILQVVNTKSFKNDVRLHGMTCEALFHNFIEEFVKVDVKRKFSSHIDLNRSILKIMQEKFTLKGEMNIFSDPGAAYHWLVNHDEYVKLLNAFGKCYFMIDLYPQNQAYYKKINNISNWDNITAHLR